MKKYFIATLSLIVLGASGLRAEGSFEVILKGKTFEDAIPKDFYLEGNRIPTQPRNSVLLKTPAGARVVIGLIDTTGYSSQISQKYEGMIISEGNFTICGQKVGVGSFGFGHSKPMATSSDDMKFYMYDQAGGKLAECSGKKDAGLAQPKPLQVANGKLYLGRHAFDLK